MANETTSDAPSGLSDIAQEVLAGENSDANDILSTEVDRNSGHIAKSGGEIPPEKPEEDDEEDSSDLIEKKADELTKGKKKTYKLKVNDKEYELDSEEKLVQAAQRGLATQQQWQKLKSEMEELRSNLQNKLREVEDKDAEIEKDWIGYARKRGKNVEDAAEQFLMDRAREWQAMQNMTERERQLYLQNKQYQAELRAKEEALKVDEEKRNSVLVQQQKEQLGNLFSKALNDAKIKPTPLAIREMANIYRAALNHRDPNTGRPSPIELSADDAAKFTKRRLAELAEAGREDISKMKAEEFVKQYPELTESIRKHLVAAAKSKAKEPQDEPRKRAGDGKFAKKNEKLDDGKAWDDMIDRLKKEGNAINVKARW